MRLRPVRPIGRIALAVARRLANPFALVPDRGRPPTATPDVGLVGFYGAGNYGDELFLEVFRSRLGAPLRLHPLLDGGGEVGFPRSARGMDVIVVGGGDIVVPWRNVRYWKRAFLERPVFITGVGVPTSTQQRHDPQAVARMRAFFRHPNVRAISARDADSVSWIRNELEPTAPLAEVPDLACALDLPRVERPSDPPIFGIAVRHRDPPDDLTQVRRLCQRALDLGYRLRRIVLATGRLRRQDTAVTERLGFPDSEHVVTDDLDAISRAIGECSLFASMKFHGVVVATLYHVPSIGLMPSAKTRRFAARIGRPDAISAFDDPSLPDLVTRDPVLLPADLPGQLREPVLDHLAGLRGEILELAAAGYPPPR